MNHLIFSMKDDYDIHLPGKGLECYVNILSCFILVITIYIEGIRIPLLILPCGGCPRVENEARQVGEMVNNKGLILFRVYCNSIMFERFSGYESSRNYLHLKPSGRSFIRYIPNFYSIGDGGLTGGKNRQGGFKTPIPTTYKEGLRCGGRCTSFMLLRVSNEP